MKTSPPPTAYQVDLHPRRAEVAVQPVDFLDGRDLRSPFIVQGAAASWKALSAWSPEALRDRVGHREVRVTHCPGGLYERGNPRRMTLSRFLDLVGSEAEDRREYYVTGVDPASTLPELRDDYQVPSIVDRRTNAGMSLFLGRDTLTNCHFHPGELNVLVQIHGRKRVVLFSPADFVNLYPKFFLAAHYNWSRIDFSRPDLAAFPNFRRAVPYEAVLCPGDLLFIPVHWWHVVYGEDWSISGAFFWVAPRPLWTFPNPGVRCLVHRLLRRYPLLRRAIPSSITSQ